MLPHPKFYFEMSAYIYLLVPVCIYVTKQNLLNVGIIRLISQKSNVFEWWLSFIYITFLNYFKRPFCLRLLIFTSLPLNYLFCCIIISKKKQQFIIIQGFNVISKKLNLNLLFIIFNPTQPKTACCSFSCHNWDSLDTVSDGSTVYVRILNTTAIF